MVFAFALTALCAPLASPAFAQLSGNCIASLQNRAVQVNDNGTFVIPNVPVDEGLYRVRIICALPDGTVIGGQSPFLSLSPPREAVTVRSIQFGVVDPIPVTVAVTAPTTALHAPGETVQLTVTGTMPDGTTRELTTRALGTSYSTSNPTIATVGQDGLVRAVSRGRAIITARNEGAIGGLTIEIDIAPDADGDGMSDDYERLFGLNPNDASDAATDLDNDGLTNRDESRLGTSPKQADTDGDGLDDGREVGVGSNPLVADTDGDGLLDGQEVARGTSPVNADTDGDTLKDGIEVQLGLDPLRPDPITTAQGRVVNDLGQAVPGASIVVLGPFTATSDGSGFFTLAGLPASLGPITAVARIVIDNKLLEGTSAPTPPVPSGITAFGTIRLSAATGTVTGLVRDPAGRTIAGAQVSLTATNDARSATTDATGRYRFDRLSGGGVTISAADPVTGLRARRVAVLDPNAGLALDLILAASGTVVGRVAGRDGVTSVGAGIDVTLFVGGVTTAATLTDTLGRYTFDYAPLGVLTVDASDVTGNRGRATTVLSATGQRVVADIAFVGRGDVQGTVRNAAGDPVANASVTLVSQSVFGGIRSATTNASGQYSIPSVFIGGVDITARLPAQQLAGQASGALLTDNTTVTIDVTLAAAGTIEGTVRRADGTTPFVGRVRLSNGLTADADAAGFYRFSVVPLGSYTLDVTDASGERGRGTASLTTQGQIATANITLTGVGAVTVTVQDGAGTPVGNATVTVTTSALGGDATSAVTNTDGRVSFQRVLAGQITADASLPAVGLSGTATGTLTAGGSLDLVVGLTEAGTITGTVLSVSGAPVSGVTVRLSGRVSRSLLASASGQFRFGTVPVGTYVLEALDSFGTVRGRSSNVIVASQDQVVTRNITLLGAGTVTGLVTNDEGTPQPGVLVRVASAAAGLNRPFDVTTDTTGRYRATGVPLGSFTASASKGLDEFTRASGSTQGSIERDGDTVTANIQLSTGLVPSVQTLSDANELTYDLRENGSIQAGTRQIYTGDGGANARGELLDVTVGATTSSFNGQTIAQSLQNGREMAVQQGDIGGLVVARKVYVPRGGYFVRYLEILTNPTQAPIVATLKLTSHFRFIRRVQGGFTFDREPRVVTTSSGDSAADASDAWVIVDDDVDGDPFLVDTLPSTAHVFDGAGGSAHIASADFATDFASRFGRLTHEWQNITVPAGGRVAIMHFASQETSRLAARTAAERLTGLPPEAVSGGTVDDLASVFDELFRDIQFLSFVSCGPDSADDHYQQALALQPLVEAARTSNDRAFIAMVALTVRQLAQDVHDSDAITILVKNQNGVCTLDGDITRRVSASAIDVASDLLDLAAVANFAMAPGNRSALPSLPSLGGTISGRTLTWDGTAIVPSAPVTFQSANALFSRIRFLNSDSASAIFTIQSRTFPVPVDGFILRATHPQTAVSAPDTPGTFAAGMQAATQDVLFTNTGSVNGTVRRGTGVVASTGGVNVSGLQLPSVFTVGIAQSGDFLVSGLKAGNYGLTAAVPTQQGTTLFGSTAAHAEIAQTVRADIQLEASGSVTGVVRREAGTVVGGLAVRLRSQSRTETAFTSTSGQFLFVDAPLGPAIVEAYDAVTNTAASAQITVAADQSITQDLTLTFGGVVTGAVRVRGTLTPGVQVTLDSLGGTRSATTDASGNYRFDRVTPGAVSVTALDSASGLQGRLSGTLGLSGETLTLDLNLVAAGTINGTVRRSDLSAPVPGARITLAYTAILDTFTTTANASGQFTISGVPVGAFSIDVVDPDTGDRGRALNQLSTNGETRTVNVVMNGQGAVNVRVRDAVGNPVGTARVDIYTQTIFGGVLTASTRDDGVAAFPRVLAGGFSANVTDPATQQTASANGSVSAGGVADLVITLGSAATITGVVTAPDGVTPVANASVRVSGSTSRTAVTGPDGVYRVEGVPLGHFTVDAYDGAGRFRARQSGVSITTLGQTVTVNLRMAALGRVVGIVKNPDSTPAFQALVEVRSLNADLGGYFTAQTDSDGSYLVTNVPEGAFTVTARDVSQRLFGESSGTIAVDGEEVTVDVQLLDNSVILPIFRYNGNDIYSDIEGSGGIGYGFNSLFYGNGSNQRGGFLLDITSNGTTTRFNGGSVGTLEFGGQQIVTRQQGLAGLTVTRKTFVPPDGYFARFLEVLQNPTPDPITVDVGITTNFYPSFSGGAPRVVASSSGDAVLDVTNPTTADRWVGIDDGNPADPFERSNEPAMAAVFDGPDAAVHVNQATLTRVGSGPAVLSYGWSNITVPANGSVALLHFGAVQLTPIGATASANRLQQSPPEALAGLTQDEIALVQNFVLPANGVSSVAPLNLRGTVSGLVFEADDTTPVAGSQVTFQSSNPIYGRMQRENSDDTGAFAVRPNLSPLDGGGHVVVPVEPFTLTAQHPVTSVVTTASGVFPPGATTVARNLTFAGTGAVRGSVRRHTGDAVTNGGSVRVTSTAPAFDGYVQIAPDGTYVAGGLKTATFTLRADASHPQGSGIPGIATVSVVAGQTTLADITLAATGNLTGTVRSATGAPAPFIFVLLRDASGSFDRSTSSDDTGAYLLTDVPEGAYFADVFEPNTGTRTTSPVVVVRDTTSTQDLLLVGLGTLSVNVVRASGAPAANAAVYVNESLNGYDRFIGMTDAGGTLVADNIAVGPFAVRAYHPDNTNLSAQVTGTMPASGAIVSVLVPLPPTGVVTGRVTTASGVAVANAFVSIDDGDQDFQSARTDANGQYTVTSVPAGRTLNISAQHPTNNVLRRRVTAQIASDGATLVQDLALPALATLQVTVLREDQTPLPGAQVDVRDSRSTSFRSGGTTDASGIVSIANVLEGAFIVRADLSGTFAGSTAGTLVQGDDGQIVPVTIHAPVRGTIQGTITAGDGRTPVAFAFVEGINVDSGARVVTASANTAGFYTLTNVPTGVSGIRVVAHAPTNFATTAERTVTYQAGDTVTVDLTLPLSVITGRVLLPDGVTPVANASAFATQLQSDGRLTTYTSGGASQGTYFIYDVPPGPVTVTGQDSTTGLFASVAGTLVDAVTPLVADVVLPGSGAVTGTIRAPNGQPAPAARVAVLSDGLRFVRSVVADASGVYTVPSVAVGPVWTQACLTTTQQCRVGAGLVPAVGASATVDMTLPDVGAVAGTVFAADGVTPVAGGSAVLENVANAGPLSTGFRRSVTTDTSGQFTVSGVPEGPVNVIGLSSDGAGIGSGVVSAGTTSTVNAIIGTAVRLNFNLDGTDGFRYDVSCDGSLSDGGTPDGALRDAYDGAFRLIVAGTSSPCVSAALVQQNGRELRFATGTSQILQVARRVFVPDTGSFARFLEIITNPTDVARTVTVQVDSNFGSDSSTHVVVAPSDTGNHYYVTDAQGRCCNPSIAHVTGGGGPVASTTVGVVDGNDAVSTSWRATVPAHGTIIVMHFAVQRGIANAGDAQVEADLLSTLSDPLALSGLSTAERQQIVNFVVP